MSAKLTVAVTGAWSYSGRFVASRLLRLGYRVVSLTSRPVPVRDPHGGAVPPIPYDFAPGRMCEALRGVDVLASAYWVRHDEAPLGHVGPWTSHAQAVEHSRRLIEAAGAAGVRRLVWTSIANPGLDPDLSYYDGKSRVEAAVRSSGLPFAILRPACFFGPGGLLVNNIAWAVRRMPCFPLPMAPCYHVRPIHVGDYARAVAAAVAADRSYIVDATGPDRVEFVQLLHAVGEAVGRRPRIAWLPPRLCAAAYRVGSALLGETVLTADELTALSRNRLDSLADPLGTVSLLSWIRASRRDLGRRLIREPARRPPLAAVSPPLPGRTDFLA